MTKQARMQVPLLDLKAQYAPLRTEIEAAIREVCDSQAFVLGPKVEELERRVAAYCGARHGIGVSSGTDALLVALMALEIGPGDEVITTPYSFFATAGVVARLGARPVFCDVEADTLNIDPDAVADFLATRCRREGDALVNKATGGRVRVLMPVHLFGQTADMDRLMALAQRHGLAVVEDAAQAIGSRTASGRQAGSIGAIGCLSFFPSKNLGAFGDGGMCLTNDTALAERLRILRVHGGKPKYYHAVIGGNFRLDALQAAVLLVKLGQLDAWTDARQRNAERYDRAFAAAGGAIGRPVARAGNRHIYNQYVIRVADRDGLRRHLADSQVGTEIYYPVPLHLQACFSALGHSSGDFPVAEAAAQDSLALPVYPELDAAQLDYVAQCVLDYAGR